MSNFQRKYYIQVFCSAKTLKLQKQISLDHINYVEFAGNPMRMTGKKY